MQPCCPQARARWIIQRAGTSRRTFRISLPAFHARVERVLSSAATIPFAKQARIGIPARVSRDDVELESVAAMTHGDAIRARVEVIC
jgi:hypothetical protein